MALDLRIRLFNPAVKEEDRTYNGIIYEDRIHNGHAGMFLLADCFEEIYNSSGRQAETIVEKLEAAQRDMSEFPGMYSGLNSMNGKVTSLTAFLFINNLAAACRGNPDAIIIAYR